MRGMSCASLMCSKWIRIMSIAVGDDVAFSWCDLSYQHYAVRYACITVLSM